jgi:ABC-type glutathione transport system ATPase component
MRARLGFATALQAESDILLLDEILAVGDADFQLKCLDVFERFKQERRTIVLVTHDLAQVQRFCDECVLLERGLITERGDPDAVIPHYVRSVGEHAHAPAPTEFDRPAHRYGDGRVRAVQGWVEDEQGKRIGRIRSGDNMVVVVNFEIVEDSDEPVFGVALVAEDGSVLYSVNTNWVGTRTERLRCGQDVEVRVLITAALRNGRYGIQGGSANRDLTQTHDLVDGIATLVVHGSRVRHGAADLQGRISYRLIHGTGDAVAI